MQKQVAKYQFLLLGIVLNITFLFSTRNQIFILHLIESLIFYSTFLQALYVLIFIHLPVFTKLLQLSHKKKNQ